VWADAWHATQHIQNAANAEKKPYQALREMFPDGTAPDVCIEAGKPRCLPRCLAVEQACLLEGLQSIARVPLSGLQTLFTFGLCVHINLPAVGFHYTNSWLHWFETALKLETDPSEIVNELIECCRKGGRISIVGAYAGYCNHFNIGAALPSCLGAQ
jgi:threonine dehydrogenase-like Zn-dependent dehydrogenase